MGEALTDALAALDAGGVVVFPTETVWGLGCRLDHPAAVDRIFRLKGREPGKPLQVLTDDPLTIAALDARAERYAQAHATVVCRAKVYLPDGIGVDGTVGVRIPAHPAALALVRGGALASTSANLAGQPTPRRLAGIRAIFGDDVDAYVDVEPLPGGIASTVIDVTGKEPVCLRDGVPAYSDLR